MRDSEQLAARKNNLLRRGVIRPARGVRMMQLLLCRFSFAFRLHSWRVVHTSRRGPDSFLYPYYFLRSLPVFFSLRVCHLLIFILQHGSMTLAVRQLDARRRQLFTSSERPAASCRLYIVACCNLITGKYSFKLVSGFFSAHIYLHRVVAILYQDISQFTVDFSILFVMYCLS